MDNTENKEKLPETVNEPSQAAEDMSETVEVTEADAYEDLPKKKKIRLAVMILAAIIIVLAALCVIYAYLCNKGETRSIDTQYYINGVNVTGMSADEAEAAVRAKFEDEYGDSEYTVQIEENTYDIPVASFLNIDASEYIDKAMAYDPGPWISRGLKYIQSLVSTVEEEEYSVEPYLENKEGIHDAVERIAENIYVDKKDASWSEENGDVSITAGISGKSVDPEKIYEEIVADIEAGKYSGSVSAPIISAEPEGVDLDEIVKALYKEPKDATFELVDNEIVINPSEEGREISMDELKKAVAEAAEGTTVVVHSQVIEPEVLEESLEGKLLADRLSGYQVIDGGSWTQINNQTLACEAINGTIVMPGEIFSFNELVGDTTEEKGYVEDYAYENNKLVKQFGGGVCRIASTLYAAVLYTNLEVIERSNHTSPVHYLPYGMDATVSYPEPDLQFLNNRNYPIMIEMFVGDDDYVHAAIYGTVEEDDLYVDVELDFQTEMLVDTYRVYYDKEGGKELSREFMHTSSYRELEPETVAPTPTPAPTATATPTVTETPTPAETPTPDPTEAPETANTPTPAPEPTPEPTEEVTPAPDEGADESGEEGESSGD